VRARIRAFPKTAAAAPAATAQPCTEQRRFGEVWISYPHAIGSTTGSESRAALYHSFLWFWLVLSHTGSQFPVSSSQSPVQERDWKLEAGNWKLTP